MATLDPIGISIEGNHLIEASAGTGKTWTIAALYVRLIIEAGFSVEQILVVTFTRAATAELRSRIRQRLEILKRILQGAEPTDNFFMSLVTNLNEEQREKALIRLLVALRNFDEAAVDTIHAFCQRSLNEFSFISGMPFETDFVEDDTDFRVRAVDDFWRIYVVNLPPLLVRWLAEINEGPETWEAIIRPCLEKPYLRLDVPKLAGSIETCLAEYENHFLKAKRLWQEERENIIRIIDSGILKNTSYSAKRRAKLYEMCDIFFARDISFPKKEEAEDWVKLTPSALLTGTRSGQVLPEHPFFLSIEVLMTGFDVVFPVWRSQMLEKLVDFTRERMKKEKTENGIRSFSDCLIDFEKALSGPVGNVLASSIRNRYRAALIDEFQDTDPIQYKIFSRLFKMNHSTLYYVGDPKQAIYSFRGADIFTYLAAKKEMGGVHTLDVNYRSVPEYVEAVNKLFLRAKNPFYFDTILYKSARAVDKHLPLYIRNDDPGAFRIFMMRKNSDRLSVDEASSLAIDSTVREIARLLTLGQQGDALIGDRPLVASDMVILVGKHSQAEKMRKALMEAGIPSAQRGRENVYETNEAVILEIVLKAVLHPTNEKFVRAALATPMLGYTAQNIDDLSRDERAFESMIEEFVEDNRQWRENGFIPMFERIMRRFDVDYHLLSLVDGERSLTNFRHLAELIQIRSRKTGQGGFEILSWLSRQKKMGGDKETLLQLESDANLIQIATIHASKGLEYPIVFCPFLWSGSNYSEKYPIYHDGDLPVLDLGTQKLLYAQEKAKEENFSEAMRHLYVALTRATYRTYIAWGWVNQIANSALSWLFYPMEVPVAAHHEMVRSLDEEAIWEPLLAFEKAKPGIIRLLDEPSFSSVPQVSALPAIFSARIFSSRMPGVNRVASYSSLTQSYLSEIPDDAGEDAAIMPESFGETIFSFPRGTFAGNCLHEIFEKLDFTQDKLISETVVQALAGHGFDLRWQSVIAEMVQDVIKAQITPDVRLCEIPLFRKQTELAFYFPIGRISAPGLYRALKDTEGMTPILLRQFSSLNFVTLQGFMRGYIDLVYEAGGRYYLIDYKSNWLGDDLIAYRGEKLEQAMVEHAYGVQYLIYCVALNRYLSQRIKNYDFEAHFGGVQYLFLRGIKANGDSGIYKTRPSQRLIERLDQCFHEGTG
ncbi:MAG TPA: exodeoxyribonuclease V subunit beta [Burkholderiales bacterium]|nr:exodeoxyribonuclease V subunit beta [Burkholderiales bacterium]